MLGAPPRPNSQLLRSPPSYTAATELRHMLGLTKVGVRVEDEGVVVVVAVEDEGVPYDAWAIGGTLVWLGTLLLRGVSCNGVRSAGLVWTGYAGSVGTEGIRVCGVPNAVFH